MESFYEKKNDIWGLPQIYKNIRFYPIKIKDVETLNLFYNLFQYPKNYIPDKQVIKSSYLKYLLYYIQYSIADKNFNMEENIKKFLKNVTNSKEVAFNHSAMDKNVGNLTIDKVIIKFSIDDVEFNETDFDTIRYIVLEQNGLSVDFIEDFRPDLEESLSFLNRDFEEIDFEDEVFILASLLKKPVNEIGEYTLFQFKKHLERMVLLHDFDLYSPLEISGQIKSKDGGKIVQHYFKHFNRLGRYSQLLINTNRYKEQNTELFDPNFIKK